MSSLTQAEIALVLYIGDALVQGDTNENVIVNEGQQGEVRALQSLSKDTIINITGVPHNQAVQQLMKKLLVDGIIITGAPPVETYGSSIYLAVQLTNAGWETYAAEKQRSSSS